MYAINLLNTVFLDIVYKSSEEILATFAVSPFAGRVD